MKGLKPMLFDSIKKYSGEQFVKDLISGIIVAIIALPLSIALALASGVGPEQGLYTAIVAGFLISFFGGSTVQIAGPTAAFATIVAGIVMKDGVSGLMIATIMAGILLILMGVFRLGALIKFIPYTITTGFTSGIALTILIGQLKDFFGVSYLHGEAPVEAIPKLAALFANFSTVNWWAVAVGVVCLLVIIFWPKVPKAGAVVPGSIIAILVGILLVKLCKLPVNTIGDLYSVSNALPKFTLPAVSWNTVTGQFGNAVTIAILAAIESLLSCVVADGMVGTRHNSNQELIAQGIGNIGSALFGGIPATGAIARTAANIKSGGRTPVAGMVHAVTLLIILVVLMPFCAWIPMPCIAAILFTVAYNMCQWRPFVHIVKNAPKSDILVLVLTFALTVVFDLVVAIEVNMILACLLFIKRMSEETDFHGWTYRTEDQQADERLRPVDKAIRVYEINGPLFFGVADRIAEITVKDFTKVLVLRMRSVPAIDFSAMKALEDFHAKLKKQGITLVLSHVNEQPLSVMEKEGFAAAVGKENICPHIEAALTRAEELIG